MKHQRALIVAICAFLLVGFTATSLVSYYLASKTMKQQIRTESLPLTSDNIYSHVQQDLLSPILVSSLMAEDTFVQDWVKTGELQPERIVRYLEQIQKKYQSITAFFVSELSHRYYHSSGVLKEVSKDDPQDDWYFDTVNGDELYNINMDMDTANLQRTTFFVNHKVFDQENNFLGVIGVGLASSLIQSKIDSFQETFGRTIFFTDKTGQVTLHGAKFDLPLQLAEHPGLEQLSQEILANPSGSYQFHPDEQDTYLHVRYIDELDWYLLVEETVTPAQDIVQALWYNLSLSVIVTLLIGWIINLNISRFQQRLSQLATKDHLTGLASRQGFEPTFHQMLETARRNRQPFSVLLLDIDHFKRVNDDYGHLQGDEVLKQIARILDDNVRHCDAISRWGGEEFILALAECDADAASVVAEKVRELITYRIKVSSDPKMVITASVGVAEFDLNESADELFSRADKALYRAKNNGRNQVAQAPAHHAADQHPSISQVD